MHILCSDKFALLDIYSLKQCRVSIVVPSRVDTLVFYTISLVVIANVASQAMSRYVTVCKISVDLLPEVVMLCFTKYNQGGTNSRCYLVLYHTSPYAFYIRLHSRIVRSLINP